MDANKLDIREFLYTPGRFFKIPDFQRPYSWDRQNVNNFLEDLEQVVESGKKHFFGSIVFVGEGNENNIIIDGQQRATTVILMLTALYHIIKDSPIRSSYHPDNILSNYLFNEKDYYQEKNRLKLKTVTSDNEIYQNIFEQKLLNVDAKKSKIYQAYQIFYDYFKDKDNLERYIDALSNFQIVKIFLDGSDDNPQKVFESINSTGKPLTDGDKIRNFALMLNNEKARKIVFDKYWSVIEKELTMVNKDYISDFFKHFIASKEQREIKLDQVYPEFKKLFYSNINDQNDIVKLEEFYQDVINYLDYYLFLKFNRDEDNDYKVIKDKAFRLNFLKIEVYFPFLMRVLDEYKKGKIDIDSFNNILVMLETYFVRRILCGAANAGALKNLFVTLHKNILAYRDKYPQYKYDDICAYILLDKNGDARLPRNYEIDISIKNMPFYTQKKEYVQLVLSSIDDQNKESKILKGFTQDNDKLSIEHIMPQKLNEAWKNDLGSDYENIHQQYLHTLANLTLTGYNSTYSNHSFNKKKTMEFGFDSSPLAINKSVNKFNKWDLAAIEERNNWWKEQIDKLWKLPVTTFQPDVNKKEYFFIEAPIEGEKIKSLTVFGKEYICKNWIDGYAIIIENILLNNDFDADKLEASSLNKFLSIDPSSMTSSSQINGSIYYYEKSLSNSHKKEIVRKLLELFDIDSSEIMVVIQ